MDSDKIPCTFEGCYQRFDTVEAMKKHKASIKDDLHSFYCKKCDEDCEDDIAYLIHQIQSRKHIACPVCGKEFKSEGGRDRHVGINHHHKQELRCPAGCKIKFDSAAAMMGHIEHNKCKSITRDDFHKHRAEQQIEKDAEDEMKGSGSVSKITPQMTTTTSDPDSNGGMSLLDNERAYVETDWRGNSCLGNSLSQGFSDLSIHRYQPLMATRAQSNTPKTAPTWPTQNNSDLLDLQEEPQVRPSKPKTLIGDNNVWGANNRIVQSHTGSQKAPSSSSDLFDTASSINLLQSTMSIESAATRGTAQQSTTHSRMDRTDMIPPAARPENQDPNAPHMRIQSQYAKPRMPTRIKLDQHWDSIQGCFVCPGIDCGAKLPSIAAFEAHLISAAHVSTKVQCPTCLKKFKTTTALVAHAESGSVRCNLRNTEDFDKVMRELTAGFIRVDGSWNDGTVKFDSAPIDQW